MNVALKQHPKIDNVAERARAALKSADGDLSKAAELFEKEVRQNSALRHMLLEPLVSNACREAVRLQIHIDRSRIWAPPALTPKMTNEQRVRALATSNLMIFPLPGGQQLGSATRAEIEAAAEFYGRQAADMTHKARWLTLVMDAVPAGKTVADVLTNERLLSLQIEARS